MRRTTTASLVLLAGLALAGCTSSSGSDDPTGAATGAATATTAAGGEAATTCAAFYEGTGTPLAERATAARAALLGGEVSDDTAYGEVNMLEQRIADLAEDAPEELSGTLEAVNAPFTEAVAAYNDYRAQPVPEEGDAPPFVDLSTVDVSGSEAAQADLETACSDAGYEVPAG